jgi:phosphatidyl-myo-inositol dimannoside synthase
MRVLMLTPDYPPASGGIQRVCRGLVGSSRFDYEVVALASPGGRRAHDAEPPATRITYFPNHRLQVLALNTAGIARALKKPPDAVLAAHLVAGPAGLAIQHRLGVPLIQYLHGKEIAARERLTRIVTRRAAASVAVSHHSEREALRCGALPARLHVIHPGVDLPAEVQRVHPSDQPPTVITVARLVDRYKGLDVMAAALPLIKSRVPDVRWVIVGSGPLRREVEARVRALGVSDSVRFAGAIGDDERDELLAGADVFAMPSRQQAGGSGGEGFGIVYLEAGAFGLPSVAGNLGGGAEAVLDGQTGITVNATDHVAVAEATTTLLLDADLRRRLGDAARERAISLSWPRITRQVDDLIEELVGSGAGSGQAGVPQNKAAAPGVLLSR